MKEWIAVKNYEGLYEICKEGEIRSVVGPSRNKDKYACKYQGSIGGRTLKWLLMSNKKYYFVTLYKDKKYNYFSKHRLLAINFIPNPENLPEVNHIDGNTFNNSLNNLEWCTSKQNAIHALKMDLKYTKLSVAQVLEIRAMKTPPSKYELAKTYGVSHQAIYRILTFKTWGFLL
jgi:DNA-binding XRE family transcriptional regulator